MTRTRPRTAVRRDPTGHALRWMLLLVLAVVGCASPGIPPGGPEDDAPPRLLRISPDSNATNAHAREIELLFDEVVSEVPSGGGGGGGAPSAGGGSFTGSPGGPSLGTIVLLSPRPGAVRVDWHRERLTIHARSGFRPNTTYTLTILPGLADLRQNVRDTAIVTVFSTGATIDRGRLGGIVFDWVTGRPAARAVVEAIAPDSTTYVTIADTAGRFVLPNLPASSFVIRGVIDASGNRAFDVREAFDTVRVAQTLLARGDSARIELLAFVHDTVGARLASVSLADSVTLRLTFDRPLDPAQPISADRFRVATRDSVVVPVRDAFSGSQYDSLQARAQRASADSLARAAAARDTTPRRPRVDTTTRRDTTRGRRPPAPPPTPSRPSPSADVVLVLSQPLRSNTFYRVTATAQRSVSGTTVAASERTFSTPKPPPATRDSTPRAPGDTVRPRLPVDTSRRRP